MTPITDTRPLRHWLHQADEPHLVVCCVEHPDPGAWSHAVVCPDGTAPDHAVVRLGSCLSDVTPAVLLELVAGGALGITVALEGCAHAAAAAEVVSRAGEFLSALGRPETIVGAVTVPRERKHGAPWPILRESDVPVSRRALIGRPDGLDLAEPSAHPTKRLVAVLTELGGGAASGTALDGIPTGVAKLTASGCAGSGVCTRSCPAGALTLTRTVLADATPGQDAIAQFQLTFNPEKCTGCGQCLHVCPEAALHASGEYLWSSLAAATPVGLRVGLIRRCARCGVGHGRTGHLCAVCAYRVANPFGSTLPPGGSNG